MSKEDKTNTKEWWNLKKTGTRANSCTIDLLAMSQYNLTLSARQRRRSLEDSDVGLDVIGRDVLGHDVAHEHAQRGVLVAALHLDLLATPAAKGGTGNVRQAVTRKQKAGGREVTRGSQESLEGGQAESDLLSISALKTSPVHLSLYAFLLGLPSSSILG